MLERVFRYVSEVRSEARRVTWPNRRQTLVFTGIVVLAVTIVALFIAGVDALLGLGLGAVLGSA